MLSPFQYCPFKPVCVINDSQAALFDGIIEERAWCDGVDFGKIDVEMTPSGVVWVNVSNFSEGIQDNSHRNAMN